MSIEVLAAVLTGVVIFLVGVVTGAILVLHGYKSGAKLVDRIKHDQTPFEDDINEKQVQTYTDGTIEEL